MWFSSQIAPNHHSYILLPGPNIHFLSCIFVPLWQGGTLPLYRGRRGLVSTIILLGPCITTLWLFKQIYDDRGYILALSFGKGSSHDFVYAQRIHFIFLGHVSNHSLSQRSWVPSPTVLFLFFLKSSSLLIPMYIFSDPLTKML